MMIYLQMCLLSGVSYLLFQLARRVSGRRSFHGYRMWSVAAQVLVIASLLLPPAVSLIPTRSLPRLEIRIRDPLPESSPVQRPGVHRLPSPGRPSLRAPGDTPGPSLPPLSNVLGALWFVGALASSVRLAWRLRSLRAMTRRAIPIRRVGRVRLAVSDQISAPFSVWLGHSAWVVLPPSILEHAADLKIAVRHELQHHRQRDTMWALVIEGLIALFFANPFIYLWKKQIVELQEFSCDEALLGQGRVSLREYGSCLVRVAEAALSARDLQAGTACMAAGAQNPDYFKSFLRRRVEMFAQHTQRPHRKNLGAWIGTLVLLLTTALAFGSQRSLRSLEAVPSASPNPGTPRFDPDIQKLAQSAVKEAVFDRAARAGFVIVADPRNGRILAAADSSRDAEPGPDPWALAYRVVPASAIKPLVAAAAIEDGRVRLDEVFDCGRGTYRLGDHVYRDHRPFDHLTAAETLIQSSNICGIRIGERLGAAGLARAMKSFGFGEGGVTSGFPGAIAGQVPDPEQLEADEFIALLSTGHTETPGFYVSPLEIVQAYAAIANGGTLMAPIEATDPTARPLRRVLSEQNARALRQVLARAVLEGTGTNAESNLYTTAGKTSTAYQPGREPRDDTEGERAIGGFVGFAPVENPRVVVYAAVLDATGRKEGNRVAAPLFREVAEKVLKQMKVAPDRR